MRCGGRELVKLGRGVKIWVFASLCSLLVWLVYLLPSRFEHFFRIVQGLPDLYAGNLGMFMAEYAGLLARFAGVVLALTAGFLVWGGEVKSSRRVEGLVEAALFLEGTYFVLLFPSGLWWLGSVNFLGVSYLLQAVAAGTVLMVLSFKVRSFATNIGVLKWIGVAAVGYVAALWANVVFRWFDMIEVVGNIFLLGQEASWGFLGSLITMSLAVVFSVIGAYLLADNKGESIWWFGLSLMMIGVHYVIYSAYSYSSGNLVSAMEKDVWTLPFLGLGASLLRLKPEKKLLQRSETQNCCTRSSL